MHAQTASRPSANVYLAQVVVAKGRYFPSKLQVQRLYVLMLRRCHRLSKECQPATFVRKAGPQKTARKSQLEDKLDSLVNLLQVSYMA